ENGHLAVGKGYISGLVSVYEDWHKQDIRNKHLTIRRAFLHCLHRAAKTSSGRHALVSEGGVAVLYNTTQACLLMKDSESLVETALQLMRKCLPKLPLPLSSGHSTYSFLLPGHSEESWVSDSEVDDVNNDDDSDDEQDNEEPEYHDYEEDLETDVNKLKARPDLDRPKEQLDQYSHFCPELHHNFQ
ncbi:cytosolic carboxypeptidase 4 isoform X1, partial [Tachysurus ichikawai]